ncbi:hypothetical protein D5R81_03800 [Parashewanella spongiae]|uniref:Outer membrane protein beta-barrel domain-containing protein n=1 Tax=Parashewanella spongiae TaxID=342950 RepID=A0A3A6UM77_9GAMM|nr:hypothetical protein [Parashewanella spongiae]MCL1078852.1 hypothetical protein [Parashewanella spongiae]RJY18801.1 hypothetical protein D5R81_03800 [Parashewanella spongiae]
MKNNIILISALLFASTSSANDKVSFGAGLGSLYAGIGINITKQSNTEMKHLSVGCVSYSNVYGETCGVGVGWIKSDIFESQTVNHGLGLYVGIVGTKTNYGDRKALYGAGIGYHYFFNGIGESGTNLGVTITGGDGQDGIESGALLQIGYQF